MTTDHDPLCPELWRWDDGQPCMFCALITRVREDGDRGNGGVTTAIISGPAADRIREALGGER